MDPVWKGRLETLGRFNPCETEQLCERPGINDYFAQLLRDSGREGPGDPHG
jgi:hypothetical protein